MGGGGEAADWGCVLNRTQPYSLTNSELQRAINDAATHAEAATYGRREMLERHLEALCAEQAKRAREPQHTTTPTAGPQHKDAGARMDAPSAGGAVERTP